MELRLITKKKKGFTDFSSLIFAIAFIFGIAIFFIILSYTYGEVKPRISAGLESAATPEAEANVTEILDDADNTIGRFNVLFPLLLIGIFAFVMVVAMMGQSHPIFFFIGLIILAAALILGAVYSNVYKTMTDTNALTSTGNEFNIMNLFLEHLPIVVLILFAAIAVVLYAKSGGSRGY